MITFKVILNVSSAQGRFGRWTTEPMKWEIDAYTEEQAVMAATADAMKDRTSGVHLVVAIVSIEAIGVPAGVF